MEGRQRSPITAKSAPFGRTDSTALSHCSLLSSQLFFFLYQYHRVPLQVALFTTSPKFVQLRLSLIVKLQKKKKCSPLTSV